MRIAQILYDKAHYIFEAAVIPQWGPYPDGTMPVLVDITDTPGVQEGWDYNAETGAFTEPVIPEPEPVPLPEPTQSDRIEANTDYIVMMLG